jgi:hypothetical protein
MQPLELVNARKGWQIVHCCSRCGRRQPNKVADGTVQPDDFEVILDVMRGDVKERHR